MNTAGFLTYIRSFCNICMKGFKTIYRLVLFSAFFQLAMKQIGFLSDEVIGIYKLVSAILHLGNVKFSETFRNGMDSVTLVDDEGRLQKCIQKPCQTSKMELFANINDGFHKEFHRRCFERVLNKSGLWKFC